MATSKLWSGVAKHKLVVLSVVALAIAIGTPAALLQAGTGSMTLSSSAIATTYGGRAFGVGVQDPLVGNTYYADTGSLPSSGGAVIADFTPVNDPAASSNVFLSYAAGIANATQTEVATMDVSLLPGNAFEVVASFVYSASSATCSGVTGTSEIPDLTVAGVSIPVTGAPNQVYSIPGVLTLVINEQIDRSTGGVYDLTVNGLDLTLASGLEVIVSSVESSVTCGGSLTGGILAVSPQTAAAATVVHTEWLPPADFMTGGGYFFNNPALSTCPGAHVNFGFNAGPRPGNPTDTKGHVNVVDHDCDHHIDGVVQDYFKYSALGFSDPQDVCRAWGGPATFDGASGFQFWAVSCDYGEPGRNDRFHIEVWDNPDPSNHNVVYTADNAGTVCSPDMPNCGVLPGGNIQLHRF